MTTLAGRYVLEQVIGRGGMADVYCARDLVLGRAVAVKWLRAGRSDEVEIARARAEGALLAGLSHTGLVTVFDAGVEAGRPFVVMELLNGITLATAISGRPMDPSSVADVGAQLAETLDYVHGRGLVHRDVKPSNVLLEGDAQRPGRVRLADFGIARLADSARQTATGALIGTAAYLAPEQVRGEHPTASVDVWALGLVLLECLTGRIEYVGSAPEAAVARLTRAPDVPYTVPPRLAELLRAMTAPQPGDRPTAGEAAAALRDISADNPESPPTVRLADATAALQGTAVMDVPVTRNDAPPPTQGRLGRRAVGAGVATVLAAAVAVGAVLLNQPAGHVVTPPGSPVPAPSLSGQTGRDLATLHRAVNP